MLSVSVLFSGNLIQEDLQANLSKMLNVTLWLPLCLRLICLQ